MTVNPQGLIEVEVTFSPSAEGDAVAVLEIASNDPAKPTVEVALRGVGIATPGEPMSIEDILAFFDAGVEAGTLDGTGRVPAMKQARLNIFKRMLVKAANMIDDGRTKVACLLLNRAYLRSDGQQRLRDFVEGEDVPELNTMILQLMADMGCEL